MAKLVHDLCTKSSSSPRSTKVSRNLSTDFKRHHLKPPETMLGWFYPRSEHGLWDISESLTSLFYSIWWGTIPNQRCPGSGEMVLLGCKWSQTFGIFHLSQPPGCEAFPGPWVENAGWWLHVESAFVDLLSSLYWLFSHWMRKEGQIRWLFGRSGTELLFISIWVPSVYSCASNKVKKPRK